MPNIDYYLTSPVEITKKDLKYKSKTPLLTPDIDLGARKFNKSQLNALKLLLCNCVKHGHSKRLKSRKYRDPNHVRKALQYFVAL